MPTPDPSSRCAPSTASRSSPAPPSSPPNFRARCSPIGDCPYLPIGRASRCARKCCIPATASRSPFACSTEIPVKGTTMMKRTLFVAIAAAFTLPALAADAPRAQKHYFTYELNIDTDSLLADASSAAKDAEQWRLYGEHMRDWAHDFANEMHGSMAYMFSDRVGRGRLVKGAPYSADAVTEMNQTLPDGNVISHKNLARVYRDSEGRTRQESFRGDSVRSVYISDPV